MNIMEYWPIYLWCYVTFTVTIGYFAYREDFIIDLQKAYNIFTFFGELIFGIFFLFSGISFLSAMLDPEIWDKIKKHLF